MTRSGKRVIFACNRKYLAQHSSSRDESKHEKMLVAVPGKLNLIETRAMHIYIFTDNKFIRNCSARFVLFLGIKSGRQFVEII